MRLSKTSDYALRIMVALAQAGDGRLSLHALADREQIPRKFLEHVIRALKQAGLVHSTPGPKGGYQLTESPNRISVTRILEAAQVPLVMKDSWSHDDLPEHILEPLQRLQCVIQEIRSFARQRFESITLADLANLREAGAPETAFMYSI